MHSGVLDSKQGPNILTLIWIHHVLQPTDPGSLTSVSGQLQAPAKPCREGAPHFPLDRRFGGPQSRFRWYGEMKILYFYGIGTPTSSQSLYRLRYRILK
jgi:hypothetical protein